MSQGGSFLPQRSCPNLLERRWSSRLATHMLRDILCVKHIHSYIMVQMVGDAPRVSIKTSMGNFEVELYVKHAPRSCKNFIELAKRGYYNGTIAHRIISDFMIQMGDPTGTGRGGESIYGGKFEDEIHPELHHTGAGILSMANAGPNTNGSQFFITLAVTPWLDGKHTIFGRVCNGMGVVKRIGNVATDANDRPTSEIKIISAQPL